MIRYNSIDVQRTLAIFLMIVCHAGIWLSTSTPQLGFYFLADNVLGDFAAAMFLFLVGVSQAVSLEKRKLFSNIAWIDFKYVLYRALIIFFLSFLLSFLVYGIPGIFEWNILSIIGLSLIVIFLLRKFSSKILFLIALFIVLTAPYLRDTNIFLSHWGGGFEWNDYLIQYNIKLVVEPKAAYIPTFSFINIIRGFCWMGMFPIFPWLVVPVIGFAVGKFFIQPNSKLFLPNKLIVIGGFFILIAFIMALASPKDLDSTKILKNYITPFCFYPNTTSMLFLQLGITTFIFGILSKTVDTLSTSHYLLLRYCNLISRYSLTLYVLHFLIIFWPLRIVGYLHGNVHKYFGNSFLTSTAILIGLGIFLMLSLLVKLWDKNQGRYSIEWLLNRVSKKNNTL